MTDVKLDICNIRQTKRHTIDVKTEMYLTCTL